MESNEKITGKIDINIQDLSHGWYFFPKSEDFELEGGTARIAKNSFLSINVKSFNVNGFCLEDSEYLEIRTTADIEFDFGNFYLDFMGEEDHRQKYHGDVSVKKGTTVYVYSTASFATFTPDPDTPSFKADEKTKFVFTL
jgi:hypothetical protein